MILRFVFQVHNLGRRFSHAVTSILTKSPPAISIPDPLQIKVIKPSIFDDLFLNELQHILKTMISHWSQGQTARVTT